MVNVTLDETKSLKERSVILVGKCRLFITAGTKLLRFTDGTIIIVSVVELITTDQWTTLSCLIANLLTFITRTFIIPFNKSNDENNANISTMSTVHPDLWYVGNGQVISV